MVIPQDGSYILETGHCRSLAERREEFLKVGRTHGMIPKIIHFAVPTKRSSRQMDIIKRAVDTHPSWTIRIWDDDIEFPDSPLNGYLRKCRSGAQFADLVRLEAVFREGGVYLDSDMRVLRPLDKLVQSCSFFIASEDGYNLTNACFGATPQHPALKSIIGYLAANEPDWDLPPNVTTGPGMFAALLRWRSDICVLPRETFYPYHHYNEIHLPHELSYCEHLWDGSWLAGWKWTDAGYARVADQTPETKRSKLSVAVQDSIRSALRPIINVAGRAVARHVAKPNVSYPVTQKIVTSTIHGHQLVVDGYDYSVSPRLVRDGYFELGSELFVAKTLKGGDWFVDVGANIGLFSMIAAGKCGPFGRVFAFEPNPAAAELLRESAAMNWCHDRVVVTQIALSGNAGKAQLQVPQKRTGDARVVRQAREGVEANDAFSKTEQYLPDHEILEIETDTLDALFPVNVPIKILKIDAEGHEASVFAGAERLLSEKAFDYIMIEAISDVGVPEWKSTLACLTKIAESGYRACTVDVDGNLIHHSSIGVALGQMHDNNLVFEVDRARA